jgi:tetratricopeptide (TPR) repeat protein
VVHFLYDWDWAAADARFRRALQADPRDAIAETWYAMFLGAMRRHDESLRRVLHAEALEPLSLSVRLSVGRCYIYARRYEQARDALDGLLKSEPGHRLTTIWLARALTRLGRADEGVAALSALPTEERTPYVRAILAHALAAAGRGEEALEICATLEQDFAEGRAGALSLVPALAELGKRERALELLREGVRRREPFVVWVATDERYDSLRELPGFRGLLRDLRLEREPEVPDEYE